MDILGIGTVLVDEVMSLDRLPAADAKAPARRRWRQMGGPVPIALAAARKLGRAVTFAGSWGDDADGAFIEANLEGRGIGRTHSVRGAAGTTGFASVWTATETGERSIAYLRGAEHLGREHGEHRTGLPVCANVLHVDGSHGDAALATARAFRAAGRLVFMDAGSPKPRTEELLAEATVVVCSAQFRTAFTGSADPEAAAEAMRRLGIPVLVMTLGAEGAVVSTRDGTFHQPGFPVEAVDTTGAGDVFSGALIHAWLGDVGPLEAVRFACAAAAWKGGRAGNEDAALPGMDDVVRLLGSR